MLRLFSFAGCVLVAAAVLASLDAAATPAAGAAAGRTAARPVPSLTPVATAKLWATLVRQPGRHRFATSECRPLRAVFYAATDWLRLTTKLAATASPCARYYISVPPLVADKTQPRTDQAWRIRALGPSFHALAEINVTGWTSWVATTGNSWYAAGVEARRRMAAAGYDVGAGDSWALNELSSAVRAGTGNARANMHAFLDGLYDGDGTAPTRGVVFTAGIGQATSELSVYRARLQDWFEDATFCSSMSRVTSDWMQEVYGDVRHYAVAGVSRDERRDALNEYLQHKVLLANAAPASASSARALLGGSYAPVANAAWQYDAAFGWTYVPVELMQDYVSAQTYALRAAGTGGFGFAWSPRNLAAMAPADFTAQTDALLGRLSASIADSDEAPEGACGAEWCRRDLAGATTTSSWRSLSSWSPSRLIFSTAPQTLAPATASAPITVELQTSTGIAYTAGLPVTVELASTSATAELSTSAAGAWAPTLTTTIPSGASTVSFYFRDQTSGSSIITAAAAGKTAGTQTVSVTSQTEIPPPPGGGGGGGGAGVAPDIGVALSAAKTSLTPNETVEIRVIVSNTRFAAATGLRALITLPSDATLLGPPAFDRGSGCTGTSTLACDLDYLPPDSSTLLRFSIDVGLAGAKTIGVSVAANGGDGNEQDNHGALTLQVVAPLPTPAVPAAGRGQSKGVTRNGTNGPNVLTGTAGPDILNGRGGNDRLAGRAGNDRLAGGADSDRLLGGPGHDRLRGGFGDDRLHGGPGRDVLDGGGGNDRITANDGTRDAISCGAGRDVVFADRVDTVARDCETVRRRR